MAREIFVESYFPTYIVYTDHEDSLKLNEKLASDIYRWRDEDDKGIVRSNKGGWHSNVNMFERNEFSEITNFIAQNIQDAIEVFKPVAGSQMTMNSMWANINEANTYNEKHIHPESHISGVYYVKVPENSGNIIFYDPKKVDSMYPLVTGRYDDKNRDVWKKVSYQPKEGRLILFPSYLEHSVDINQSSEDRISISFNFHQVVE